LDAGISGLNGGWSRQQRWVGYQNFPHRITNLIIMIGKKKLDKYDDRNQFHGNMASFIL
jgi:hypothetical protein